ncbi:hypothetical protein GDO86_008845 [Hymenochirus boettgeri]|uniref:COMM domain-containing protein n=1 Tax=Hymenochirus boettgeri TaxID=247094 RepID=A0A8T2J3T1_9PIPI|nr:hypothetical protein GDO86_008845 [Hymenochirus boettgeri]
MAVLQEREFTALQLLLKAPSKDVVAVLCQKSFPQSAVGCAQLIDCTSTGLSISHEEASQMVHALHTLTRHVVYKSLTTAEEILSVFPEDFHHHLKSLLTKLILDNLPLWRNEVLNTQISLPRLVDLDWRVDIKTASDSVSRMAIPTCLLQMKVQEDAEMCGPEQSISTLTIELNKETLDTMLDGLGRIRDQLSAVADK